MIITDIGLFGWIPSNWVWGLRSGLCAGRAQRDSEVAYARDVEGGLQSPQMKPRVLGSLRASKGKLSEPTHRPDNNNLPWHLRLQFNLLILCREYGI